MVKNIRVKLCLAFPILSREDEWTVQAYYQLKSWTETWRIQEKRQLLLTNIGGQRYVEKNWNSPPQLKNICLRKKRRGYHKAKYQARKWSLSWPKIPSSLEKLELVVMKKGNSRKIHFSCQHKKKNNFRLIIGFNIFD